MNVRLMLDADDVDRLMESIDESALHAVRLMVVAEDDTGEGYTYLQLVGTKTAIGLFCEATKNSPTVMAGREVV